MGPPPTDGLLQLVFSGECLHGHDPQAVRSAVAQALKFDGKRTARLFSGKRVVLRRELSEASAHRHIARFAMMGELLRTEPSRPRPPRPQPVPDQPRAAGHARAVWRTLRWTGFGVWSGGCGLVPGLVVGPALTALWPETNPPRAAVAARATANSPLPAPPLAAASPWPAVTTPTAAPAAAPAADDEPPRDMTAEAAADRERRYLYALKHKAFAISAGGAHAWHAGAASENEAAERALARCMAARRADDDGCRVVDIDGNWKE